MDEQSMEVGPTFLKEGFHLQHSQVLQLHLEHVGFHWGLVE